MKVLFIKRHSLGREDIKEAFERLGHEVFYFDGGAADDRINPDFEAALKQALDENKPDFVFSSNFFPIVSNCCNEKNIKYISWVYDCPHISLYSYTVLNPCNYIFIFDKIMFDELVKIGLKNVYYAPLCSNPERYADKGFISDANIKDFSKFRADVAFVGRMYSEEHNLYDERLVGIDEYTKGYLEALIEAQLKVSGYYFIEDALNEDIINRLQSVVHATATPGGAESVEYIYAHYFLGRKITQIERERLLRAVSQKYELKLYTPNETPTMPKAINMGTIDYDDNMAFAFRNAKINLNISLRSIRSGIPLRCFDIIACGGFLLSNYQADFADCFTAGEDFDYYVDENDLLAKIDYYLTHETEREQMRENAYEKLKKYHTYNHRIKDILDIVFEK